MNKLAQQAPSPKRLLVWLMACLVALLPIYADESALIAQAASPSTQAQPPGQPAAPSPAPPAPAQPTGPLIKDLKVMVLAGNGENNDLERRIMAPLVVQVLDQNDRPVQSGEVTFAFPASGPGATFPGGKTSSTVRTNGTGEAAALNWIANGQAGSFEVHVSVIYGNESGEATVKMNNVTHLAAGPSLGTVQTTNAKASSHWYSPTWVKIALIAGVAGIGAGVALGLRGGHSGSGSTISISPGTPTVGGP